MKSVALRLVGHGAVAVFVLLIGSWVLFLRPPVMGGPATYVIVRGGSMLPTYKPGDLVIVHSQLTYSAGDIAAYRVPQGEVGAGHVVIHRIIGGDAVHGFTFKGDNNKAPDPWLPKRADMVGLAWAYLAGWGKFVLFIRQPIVTAALAAAITVTAILIRAPKPNAALGEAAVVSSPGKPGCRAA
jgi:signal peptidase